MPVPKPPMRRPEPLGRKRIDKSHFTDDEAHSFHDITLKNNMLLRLVEGESTSVGVFGRGDFLGYYRKSDKSVVRTHVFDKKSDSFKKLARPRVIKVNGASFHATVRGHELRLTSVRSGGKKGKKVS